MAGILLPFCSIFFSGLLLFIFYSKKRINLFENKIYSFMLIFSFIDSILTTTLQAFVPNGFNELELFLIPWLNRIDVILCVAYTAGLLLYTLTISSSKFEKDFKKMSLPFFIFYVIGALLIMISSVDIIQSGENFSVSGGAISIAYILCGLNILATIIFGLINIKKKDKRYTPIYAVFFIILFLLILFKVNPFLIVISITFTFIDYIMYHSIENPDLVVIEELVKAKDQAEKYSNDKAVFLFNMSQQMRDPLKNIESLTNDAADLEDIVKVKEYINNIKIESQRLQYIVNGSLDLSEIDAKDIKITDNLYNLKSILDQINLKINDEIKDKNIKFNLIISEDLPEKLYGDSIRMKQILNTLLSNAVKHTDEGTIELNVNSIIKREVCRLIIKVEDTGRGIHKEILNKLFEKTDDIDFSVDNPNVTLRSLKKMINLIGGTIMVQSEVDKGTEFTVMLDQRIYKDVSNSTVDSAISKYNAMKKNKGRIILIYEDNVLDNVMKMIDTTNFEITKFSNAEDALNSLRKDLGYNLIILDEKITKLNPETIIKKLKFIDGFDIPVIITSDKLKLKDSYLEMGFNDVLIKPISFKEFDICVNKYFLDDNYNK